MPVDGCCPTLLYLYNKAKMTLQNYFCEFRKTSSYRFQSTVISKEEIGAGLTEI